jgi:mitotic spindle assembly checkpoint protein MAD1
VSPRIHDPITDISTFRNFVPEDKPIDDALTLHQRLSALSKLHTELQSKLDEKTAENDRLHKRLSKVAIESKETVLDLSRKFDDASRELRWATERCRNAESRERLLKAELENSPAPAPAGGSSDSTANVHKLQNLVNTYKAEIEAMERDSRGAEERLAKGAGLVKAAALKEAQERGNKLESGMCILA